MGTSVKTAKTALCPSRIGKGLGRAVSRAGSGLDSLVPPHGKETLGKWLEAFSVSEHKLVPDLFLDGRLLGSFLGRGAPLSAGDRPATEDISADILSQDSRESCRVFPALHKTPPVPAALTGGGQLSLRPRKWQFGNLRSWCQHGPGSCGNSKQSYFSGWLAPITCCSLGSFPPREEACLQ